MKTLRAILIGLFAALALAMPAAAQAALTLSVNKDFGYNNGSQIRGTFSMTATSSSALKSVTFFVDGKTVKQADGAPFTYQFQTTDFADGWHDLSATAVTADGQTLTASTRRFEFVSQAQEQAGMGGIIGPILGVVVVIFVVVIALQFLGLRRSKREPVPLGTQRKYGIGGGAICPRCGRPTRIHLGALNLGPVKLGFCENCGRFGLLKVASIDTLRRAEAAELAQAQPETPIPEQRPEDRLREQLDASKFDEMK